MPFVSPPAKLELSPGLGSKLDGQPVREVTALRVGVHPWSVTPRQHMRRFDLGAGYAAEHVAAQPGNQGVDFSGAYVQADAYPWLHGFRDVFVLRAGPRMTGLFLVEKETRDFVGGWDLGGTFEFTRHWTGPFEAEDDDGDLLMGVAYGELSVGVHVSATYRRSLRSFQLGFNGGLSFRVPLAAGVFVF